MQSFINQVKNDNPYKLMKPIEEIQDYLDKLGLDSNSHVVIYSHNTKKGVLYSSYLAFLLIYNGFENVSILDGGYLAWIFAYDFLISRDKNKSNRGSFEFKTNDLVMAKLEDINESENVIFDARSEKKYFGVKKSKDIDNLGHIKGAKTAHWLNNFLSDNTIRGDEDLKSIYVKGYKLNRDSHIIVYGENSLDASMLWYVLYQKMGFKHTKLYEASLLEWSDKNMPMERFIWE
jgi:thiosulfate/3-mercaptopyruvate sulfurtransferase